jgi:hypothetical protein
MVRKTLLATTALVLGATVAFAAHHQSGKMSSKGLSRMGVDHVGAAMLNTKGTNKGVHNNGSHVVPGKTIFSNFSKDTNAEYISWYGFTAVSSTSGEYISHSYHYKFSEIGNNAEAFTGTGKAPKSAEIPGFGYASTDMFEAEIYTSSGGLPGASVATTSATTWSDNSDCCTSVRTVNFSGAPKLGKGKTYFVGVKCASAPCDGGWNMEDTDMSGATVDFWHIKEYETYNFDYGQTYTYSFSSPWHASTIYPEAGAIVINK